MWLVWTSEAHPDRRLVVWLDSSWIRRFHPALSWYGSIPLIPLGPGLLGFSGEVDGYRLVLNDNGEVFHESDE